MATSTTSHAVLLQVVPGRVIGENRTVTTYAMLDPGSEITLIDPSLLEHIGTPGRRDKLSVSTVGNNNDLQDGYRVNLSIESIVDENLQRLTLSNNLEQQKIKNTITSSKHWKDKSKMGSPSRCSFS